jgi:hypothetical protein
LGLVELLIAGFGRICLLFLLWVGHATSLFVTDVSEMGAFLRFSRVSGTV